MKRVTRGMLLLLAALWLAEASLAADEETMPDYDTGTEEASVVRLEQPLLHAGLDLQYYAPVFPNYVLSRGRTGTDSLNGVALGLEWLPIDPEFGKLGLGGTAAWAFQSKANDGRGGHTALNFYTGRAYLSYRLDYFHNQILVPFGKIGVGSTWVNQTGVPGTPRFDELDYGGGIQLCLNQVDPDAARDLNHTAGVHNSYFIVEYTKVDSLGKLTDQPDLRHQEIRFGLRFEL